MLILPIWPSRSRTARPNSCEILSGWMWLPRSLVKTRPLSIESSPAATARSSHLGLLVEQPFDRSLIEADSALRLGRLRWSNPRHSVGCGHALADSEFSCVVIDVDPSQPAEFSSPESCEGGNVEYPHGHTVVTEHPSPLRTPHHTSDRKPTALHGPSDQPTLPNRRWIPSDSPEMVTDQKVGSSNLSGRAERIPRHGGGFASFGGQSGRVPERVVREVCVDPPVLILDDNLDGHPHPFDVDLEGHVTDRHLQCV
jgi:hypothetical protein